MAGDDELFTKIIRLAAPMQDQRDDVGHAATVTHFARILCKKLKADEKIVMPAAILHDIGYYGIPKERLRAMMTNVLNGEVEELKEHHMVKGAERAEQILQQIGYKTKYIVEIKRIISRHDTAIPCESIEEKAVRDADKLARFSNIGFFIDVKRKQVPPQEWHDNLFKKIDKPDYFQTEEARTIAREELAKRRKEF